MPEEVREFDPLKAEIMDATYRALVNHGYGDLTVQAIASVSLRTRWTDVRPRSSWPVSCGSPVRSSFSPSLRGSLPRRYGVGGLTYGVLKIPSVGLPLRLLRERASLERTSTRFV